MALGTAARIVLAEDHRILREGMRAIFRSEADLELVGEAEDGREAIHQARELRPDLLILDLSMPRMDGLSALGEIKRVAPGTRVLVMTVHRTEEYVFKAIEAGADGYVLKDASAPELLVAVRSVLRGERYLCAAVASQFVTAFLNGKTRQAKGSSRAAAEPRSPLETLSSREREVLKLIAEGYRSRAIGDFLCISEKTVEKHRANLMRKLGVNSATALTAIAIEQGLVTH
ncbi:MAG: response regulator [Bdellovibrio bacteriovorus]